tara:strand:+ start:1630 stop:2064 length:435 start_codon:yes stop_codon:yes gene_type:complete
MEESKYFLFFFIGLFIIMVIMRIINLSQIELNLQDIKELDIYKKNINQNDQNDQNDKNDQTNLDSNTIENFSNQKFKELKQKNKEVFLNASYNKKNKEKFNNTRKESVYDYYKRLSKIDAKWSRNSRDVVKKFFKFKEELIKLF